MGGLFEEKETITLLYETHTTIITQYVPRPKGFVIKTVKFSCPAMNDAATSTMTIEDCVDGSTVYYNNMATKAAGSTTYDYSTTENAVVPHVYNSEDSRWGFTIRIVASVAQTSDREYTVVIIGQEVD